MTCSHVSLDCLTREVDKKNIKQSFCKVLGLLLVCIQKTAMSGTSWRHSMPSMEHLYRWSLYSGQKAKIMKNRIQSLNYSIYVWYVNICGRSPPSSPPPLFPPENTVQLTQVHPIQCILIKIPSRWFLDTHTAWK